MEGIKRALVGLLVLAAAACAPQEIRTTTDDPAPTSEEETTPPAAEEEPPPARPATIGDTHRGVDDGEGNSFDIKLTKLQDPTPGDDFFQPEPGNRFVAAQFKVTNRGPGVFEDCFSNGMSIIDGDDQEWSASFVEAREPELGCPKIGTGSSRSGWVTFEVPKSAKLVVLQYTPASGFGDTTVEWRL